MLPRLQPRRASLASAVSPPRPSAWTLAFPRAAPQLLLLRAAPQVSRRSSSIPVPRNPCSRRRRDPWHVAPPAEPWYKARASTYIKDARAGKCAPREDQHSSLASASENRSARRRRPCALQVRLTANCAPLLSSACRNHD